MTQDQGDLLPNPPTNPISALFGLIPNEWHMTIQTILLIILGIIQWHNGGKIDNNTAVAEKTQVQVQKTETNTVALVKDRGIAPATTKESQ